MRSLTVRVSLATAAAVALAYALWATTRLFAPHLIVPIYRVAGGSNLTLVGLSIIGPMLVALPFGIAYGLAEGHAPLRNAAAVATGAAFLVSAFAAFAGSVSGNVWWIVPLEAVAFVAEFVLFVLVTRQLSVGMRQRTKFAVGATAYILFTAIAVAAPPVYFCLVLKVCSGAA